MVAAIHAAARRAAKERGERFYFTGEPCKHGHICKRYTATGLCSECATAATLRSQAKAPEHPNRIAARERGEIEYTTGVPCKHGHDRRSVATGACKDCSPRWVNGYKNAHPGLEASWARKRRAKNPLPHRAEVSRWIKKNPEKVREIALVAAHNRRARMAAIEGRITKADIADLRRLQKGRCAGCNEKMAKLELDHIVAVINGGSNKRPNLQLLCRSCNATKSDRDAIAWAQSQGRLL